MQGLACSPRPGHFIGMPTHAISPDRQAPAILDLLERRKTKKDLDNLARFGITATNPIGVSMANIQAIAKALGKDHKVAELLWKTNVYEARLLACYVDEPHRVTPTQMDRWCRQFDNWGICDTACFVLFDRTPHAWDKVVQWSSNEDEFIKRGAFALLASLGGHDKTATAQQFLECLPLIERAATDDRNFVKKGVSWALRSIGRRAGVKAGAVKLAKRLADSTDPTARWLGRTSLRDLTKA